MLNTSPRLVNKNSLTWWYVFKTSWRCLQDVFARRLEDVLKTSSRRLGKTSWRCPENVLKTSWKRLEDVRTRRIHIRCMINKNIFVFIKMSWRRLHQDECLLGIFVFQFPFFLNSINLAYVSQLGNKDLVSDDIFTSQRESHSLSDMGFLLTFNYFVPFGVIENRFIKLTSSILMEVVTIPVVLVYEFYFYRYHHIKAWLFEKIIFELVYLFYIALKSLVSY